nr:unnamed protein product [Callosobruchus chinensis]
MGSTDPEQWKRWYEELASDDENEVYADDEDNDSEVDAVEVDERDTDTEQDGVSDDSSDETEISDDYMYTGIPMYTGKDGQTKWSKMLPPSSRTISHNLVLRIPGPVKAVKSAKTILQCFSTFIDDTMIDIIVICTNIKIEEIKRNFQRERDARETDSCEIKAFIGILYMAGTMKSGRQNILDLWATDGTGCEHVYLTMSYNRFRFICRCIRFDNIHDRHERRELDKLAPIRDIFEKFVDQCKSAFIPSAYLTVDEQLIAFRGRCSFRQYLPSKPAKYGIKLFALVDVNSMSTINLEIYAGKQVDGPFVCSNSPNDVVKRMIQPIRNTNRNITVDRWFTSLALAEDLLKQKVTVIGTIKANKRELPPELVNVKQRPPQSSIFAYQPHCSLVSYVPRKNKNVLVLSTMHHDDKLDKDSGKPDIIMDYNRTKFGVDVVDKMCASYDVSRNSRRWPLTVFFDILNIGGINMLNLFVANNNYETIKRKDYLKSLAKDLTLPLMKKRMYGKNIPPKMITKIRLLLDIDEEEPISQDPPRKIGRGRCYLCPRKNDKKTPIVCTKCQGWTCKTHQKILCSPCVNKMQ